MLRKYLALVLLLWSCSIGAFALTGTDVPTDHWAYDAVNQLASRGYLAGYPDGLFHGDKSMTRYEFATIVKRILDEMNGRVEALETAGNATTTSEVTKADLQAISKLTDEFKIELTVIGTRLDNMDATIKKLQSSVESMDAIVNKQQGELKTVAGDVSKLKRITLSGYIQNRYQTSTYDNENQTNDAFDTFLVRRARIKVVGKMGKHSGAVLQLDMGRNEATVKDTYMTYTFGDTPETSPTFQIGQQNWWFGYDVPYSSSKRETPERALVSRRFFPGERDQGAVIVGPTSAPVTWIVGAYNGTGTQNGQFSDLNNSKDFLGRLVYHGKGYDFGISGYNGVGVWQQFGNPATYLGDVSRIRYGGDFQYYARAITLKAEYMRGKGFDQAAPGFNQNDWDDGYYAQINYNMTAKDMFVARYSSLAVDPTSPIYGRRSAWELGLLRWMDDRSKFKLFYKKNLEANDPSQALVDNDVLVAEWLVTY